MKSGSLVFNSSALKKEIFGKLVEEQTARLIAYAEEKIMELGERIMSYHRANHLDRYGNLINSLCWGVAYDNELKASGFFRNASAVNISYLHEFSKEYAAYPVDGHAEAERYIRQYGRLGSGGGTWRVWFAILAPYWGYWEEGFTFRKRGADGTVHVTGSVSGLHVMSQFYDSVTKDLKPAKTTIKIHVEKYSKLTIGRDHKSRVNNPYSKFNRKWGKDPRSYGNLGDRDRKIFNKKR